MKPRIANYGLDAAHEALTVLPSLDDPVSIADFQAFAIDPGRFRGGPLLSPANLIRRQTELRDLIRKKGGLVLCVLRPNDFFVNLHGTQFTNYTLFEIIDSALVSFLKNTVRAGAGSSLRLVQPMVGPSAAYFQILKNNLGFTAFLETTESGIAQRSGTVLAIDSVEHPIAAEFKIGEGLLTFVLPAHNVTGEQLGAAIVNTVKRHFNRHAEVDAPPWTETILVPGADAYDNRLTDLEKERDQLTAETLALNAKRTELLNFKRLLFGYGKSVLETQVRVALRLLGFLVPEPEDYEGEWDVETRDESGRTAIGEVEGSEGFIDVDKYRQLLDYIESESLDGRNHKGVLIGNGFRLSPVTAPERSQQFSEHALRGAQRNAFCLLPTTELFKAVCAVLETPHDEGLKIKIRESILTTVGVWSFVR